jgi:prepilin-type N-terminal cleavage/methylation domain-containing protein
MKKGFTLIELLAVIIILAAVALLVTPMITGIIDDTRKKAAADSAQGYIRAVNTTITANQTKYLTLENMGGSSSDINTAKNNLILDTDYTSSNVTYETVSDLNAKGVSVDGDKPTDGYVSIMNSTVLDYALVVNGYLIEYNTFDGTITTTKGGSLPVTPTADTLTLPLVAFLKSKGGLTEDGTSDNNLRYLSSANNYVSVKEGESTEALYQIIGIMSNTADGNSLTASRVKLIRVTAMTGAYGSSSTFTESSIYSLLNTNFKSNLYELNTKDITTQYYNGVPKYITSFADLYRGERFNTATADGNTFYTNRYTPVNADVGLMYASDCLYASWLGGYGLTVTPSNGTTVYYCGGSVGAQSLTTKATTDATTAYHPVIYLPSNALVKSGTGTSASPFVIAFIK